MNSKSILITGANGGIGAEIAKLLSHKNVTIGLHYNSNKSSAFALADEISSRGALPVLLQADLSNPEGRKFLLKEIDNNFKSCDILINNAGSSICEKEFGDYMEKDVESIIGLNFLSPFFIAQQLFPSMCENNYGRIVNISSIGVKYGGGNTTCLYSASKAALELLTLNLAKIGAKHNVLVNTIRAGVIATPFHKRNTPNKNMEHRKNLIPLGRMGTPSDIANMVQYLLSPKADFITGETITISGGD